MPSDSSSISDYRIPDDNDWWISLSATNTLGSTTDEQALFDSVGGGALYLLTGVYFFDTAFSLSSMSATSGNCAFDILGGGTATIGSVLYSSRGVDEATDSVRAWQNAMMTQGQTPASAANAGTATTFQFHASGNFRVTAAGTIIPSVSLVTAAAAVVAVGSFFRCKYAGPVGHQTRGPWS